MPLDHVPFSSLPHAHEPSALRPSALAALCPINVVAAAKTTRLASGSRRARAAGRTTQGREIACAKLPARNCPHEMAPELPPRMAERKGPEIDSPDLFASAQPRLRAPPKTRNRLKHSHENFVRTISCGSSCSNSCLISCSCGVNFVFVGTKFRVRAETTLCSCENDFVFVRPQFRVRAGMMSRSVGTRYPFARQVRLFTARGYD